MEVYIQLMISLDSNGPLWSTRTLLSYEIVLYSNTGTPLILGMSGRLVHVAAGLLRLCAPGRVRNLFHRDFLSDVQIQRILQSSIAKGPPTVEILSSMEGHDLPEDPAAADCRPHTWDDIPGG
jgi:hypothetical protein